MNENLKELDFSVEELELMVGLGNCAGVSPETCNVLTGLGVGMSFVSIALTIT